MQFLEFLELIYQHTPNPNALIAWGDFITPTYMKLQEALEPGLLTITEDRDHYYTPAVYNTTKRTKGAVMGASVCWADVDDYKFNDAPVPLVPPSIIISSGRGRQLLWLLDKFAKPDILEVANRQLSAHLGIKNEGTFNANRMLRTPGSYNCKYKKPDKYPDYKEAYPCEIISVNTNLVYNISDLYRLQPYDPVVLTTPTKADDATQIDRHKRDYNVILMLANWGISEVAQRRALLALSDKARERKDYEDRTIERVNQDASRGFQAGNGKKQSKTKEEKQIANAEFKSIAQLVDRTGTEIGISVLVTWDDMSVTIPARTTDFCSRKAITDWLIGGGASTRIFMGTDRDAVFLWAHLVRTCPKQTQLLVDVAGRHTINNQPVLVTGANTMIAINGHDPGVFWTPAIKVQSELSLGDPVAELDLAAIDTIMRLTLACQPANVIQPTLGWLAMCPFKAVLQELRLKLPVLMLFGYKGSGKTTYLQDIMLPLVGLNAQPIAAELSYFSIIGHMSYWNAWPVWIDEFRATNKNASEIEQLVRSLYDTGTVERGTPHRTVESYQLTSPLVVSGESAWYDAATAERTLAVKLWRMNVEQGTPYVSAYRRLRTWGLEHHAIFAREYLRWTLTKTTQDVLNYYEAGFDIFSPLLVGATDRIINNLAVTWAGLNLFRDYLLTLGIDILIPDRNVFVEVSMLTAKPGLGTLTHADRLIVQLTSVQELMQLGLYWEPDTQVLWFNLDKVASILHNKTDPEMLAMQLLERTNLYVLPPKSIKQRGGGQHWGIDINKARELGLNVSAPTRFSWADDDVNNAAIEFVQL